MKITHDVDVCRQSEAPVGSGSSAASPNEVQWDLSILTGSTDAKSVIGLLEQALEKATALERHRGTIASLDAPSFAGVMQETAAILELLERSGNRAFLEFAGDVRDPANGQLVSMVRERSTTVSTKLIFLDLEWCAVDGAHATELMADPALAFCKHYLAVARTMAPHQLGEAEERVMTEKSVTGVAAWTRLFEEQLAAITVHAGSDHIPLEVALARTMSPDPAVRKETATAITEALEPGLRTRAYIYNTLLADKSTDDRLRAYTSWSSSRNLANQATDASVKALVDAVARRNDIPQRWYRLKGQLMGVDQLNFYDRNAALDFGTGDDVVSWPEAIALVTNAYNDFSPVLGAAAKEFFDNPWIDAGVRDGKQGGAFCAPIAPGINPFLLVSYTGTRRDVLTLAHEVGHGIHFLLAGQHQSVFELMMPLTVAETASVFGETLTFGRLLEKETDPRRRLSLLAANVDGQIATVFRQVAMFRFEDMCHEQRRRDGELSVDAINANWMTTQSELFGGTVNAAGYETWWSYVTHFVHVPGYVYAYAFGQLLALSVYQRSLQVGESFVPGYLELLRAGGSRSPEGLAALVGCDLTDANFWEAGLELVDATLRQAEEAAAIVASLPN
jgi:oligoendopeptidase F